MRRNGKAGGKASIFIVEDHPVFRDGLTQLIDKEHDLEVTGSAESAEEAMEAVARSMPSLMIIDITLKDSSGIELIKEIRKKHGDVPMLVLSMHDESLYAERSLQAGARGYIMKQETSRSIVKAIRRILSGGIYVSDNVVGTLLNRVRTGPDSLEKSPVESLSDREFMVLRLIGEGRSTGEIADLMHLSARTISTYRERIKEKLHLKNAAELVRFAFRWVEEN